MLVLLWPPQWNCSLPRRQRATGWRAGVGEVCTVVQDAGVFQGAAAAVGEEEEEEEVEEEG